MNLPLLPIRGWPSLRRWLPALALVGASLASAAPIDFGKAIDTAGRQRMLTQRIVKSYCQVGMRLTPETSRAQLIEAVRRFGSQQVEIRRSAPDAATRRALARSAALWAPVRRLAMGQVTRDGARRLAERSEHLLRASDAVVVALQEAAGTPQSKLVNIAGRQRMLSQRLAKLYMLRAWGVDTPDIREQMEAAGSDFAAALGILRAAPENTAEIARELDAVALQWEWFSGAIKLQGAQSYTLVVADASESILNSMDLITGKYAQLAGH